MAEKRDYYEVLGVAKDADDAAIKKAYREIAKKYHPDINPSAEAAEIFKEASEAYSVLSDQEKRAQYDQFGHAAFDGSGGGYGGGFSGFSGDMGDIFGDIFGDLFGGGRSRRNDGPMKGANLRTAVRITFDESVKGCEKELKLNLKDPCPTCRGTGREKQSHTVSVKIPAGVETGQQIRLAGQGEAGFNGGPYGDLFVVINVNPSDKFTRDGSTIYYTLNISFVQAALGDTVEVPTVHGNVEMVIPAGTQTGKTFRLKGKGAPRLRGGSQGDQLVTVKIVTPTKLNDAQKEALLAFAKASGDEKVAPQKKGFFNKVKDVLEDL